MTALAKARLAEITSTDNPTEVKDSSVPVQFNPTSLRVQIANKTAGGQQAGAQARQRPGTGEMQVSFDLVFDTADEAGEGGKAVDVLKKTADVERFVRPKSSKPGEEASGAASWCRAPWKAPTWTWIFSTRAARRCAPRWP